PAMSAMTRKRKQNQSIGICRDVRSAGRWCRAARRLRRVLISAQQIISPSSNSRPSGYGCALMSLRLGRLGGETSAHLAEVFDLGLHDIAGFEKTIGALADAAAGAAAENVAALQSEDVRGVFDLLFGREDELRGVAVLLDLAIHSEADEQVHVVRHEGARHQERSHRREIVVALAAEPVRAQPRPVRADLHVAA